MEDDFPSSLPLDVRMCGLEACVGGQHVDAMRGLMPGLLEPWHAHPNTQGLHPSLDVPPDTDTDTDDTANSLQPPVNAARPPVNAARPRELHVGLRTDVHMCRGANNVMANLRKGGAGSCTIA